MTTSVVKTTKKSYILIHLL